MKRAFFASLVLGAAALLGCPTTSTSSTFTPVTGIEIDSASLVGGIGCGTAAGQVFRYAAVLSYAPEGDVDGRSPASPEPGQNLDDGRSPASPEPDDGAVPAGVSGVFDCFANGILSNLAPSEAGSLSFTLSIFAFDAATFPPELSCSTEQTSAQGGPQGVQCPGNTPANVIPFESRATWTTTCTAEQVQGVTVLAVCPPLEPTGGPAQAHAEAGVLDSAAGE